MKTRLIRTFTHLLLTLICSTGLAITAHAQKTTTSTSAGSWDAITWDNGAPAAGDTVILDHNVTLTQATPLLADLTVNAGRTLTFGDTNAVLNATEITILGNVTHPAQTATTTNSFGEWVVSSRILIVCSNLTVTGSINANEKGYTGAPSAHFSRGRGPGGGYGSEFGYNGGGGYGGQGGSGNSTGASSGPVYGTPDAPVQPGSGAGASAQATAEANGGGLILINASGHVLVNGTISANGQSGGNHPYGAGGSGGGISITAATIYGSGSISANGGARSTDPSGVNNGPGGGGRIAINITDTAAQGALGETGLRFSAAYGNNARGAQLGTIFLPTPGIMGTTLSTSGRYLGFDAWAPSSLTITNAAVAFDQDGIQINVTGDVLVHSGALTLGPAVQTLTDPVKLTCGGNLVLTNSSTLRVYASGVADASSVTNHLAPVYGGEVSVGGALQVYSGNNVFPHSHPTNGGSVIFRAQTATIGGTFNADGLGFAGGAAASGDGFGPGRGIVNGENWRWAGGGYGGKGHLGGGGTGGAVYGVAETPVAPGSGGAGNGGAGAAGGRGGGLIRIDASGTLTLTGTLTANGNSVTARSSAGSGGAIFLTARRANSTGIMRVNGGNGHSTDKADGGGGRIAIAALEIDTTGSTISYARGTSGGNAADGSYAEVIIPPKGTVMSIR